MIFFYYRTKMNRRTFGKALAVMMGAVAFCPEALAAQKDITLDVYIDKIKGDALSASYYKKDHGVFKPIFDKVVDFYSEYFSMGINYRQGKVDEKLIKKNQIAFQYTTLNSLLNEPRKMIYSFGGKELIDELESEIQRAIKEQNWTYKQAESEIFGYMNRVLKQAVSGEGGFGSRIVNRAWMFPSKTHNEKAESAEELINAYAFVAVHEIGHALGLDHPKGQGFYSEFGQNNFMNPKQRFRDVLDFNLTFHHKQAENIRERLDLK